MAYYFGLLGFLGMAKKGCGFRVSKVYLEVYGSLEEYESAAATGGCRSIVGLSHKPNSAHH